METIHMQTTTRTQGKRAPKGVKLKTIPTNCHLVHEFIFYLFGDEVIIKTLKAKST